jgi:hypothetical protein
MAKIIIDTSTLIQRTFEAIGFIPKSQANKQSARAYESGFYDAMDGNDEPPSGTLASYGYQRKTAHGLRDFTKLNNDQILNIAWILYQSNPLAKRYFEIVKDHILGRGVEPAIEDEELREIVEVFWQRNNLDEQLPKFVIQKRLFGEQCYPAFVRKSDGQVTLGYIDPADIEHIITHPDNVLRPYAVVLKSDTFKGRRIYRIIMKDEGYVQGRAVITPNWPDKLVTAEQARLEPWETAVLSKHGLSAYTGSCFYFSVNNVSNQPRGHTDLLQSSDWLDADDETLFALADREQMGGYFSWDVKLIGIDDPQVKAKAAEIRQRVPKKGQALVHNDKEEWTMQAPDLKQAGSIATSEALADRAWNLLGMPRHWRGIGDDANRASAGSMDEPTRKTLESKQDDTKRTITTFLAFVRDQAEIAGYWKPATDEAGEIEITMPEMTKVNTVQVSDTLGKIVDALDKAQNTLKVITRTTSAKAVSKVLAEMGIEYDPTEELEAAEKEAEEREKKAEEKQKRIFQQQAQQNGPAGPNGAIPNQLTNGKQPQQVNGNGNHNGNGIPAKEALRQAQDAAVVQPFIYNPPRITVNQPDLKPTFNITQPAIELNPKINITTPEIYLPESAITFEPQINIPETVVNITEAQQPAPVVNVTNEIPAPVVNVAAPEVTVNVPKQAAPVVNVAAPAPAVTVNVPAQDAPVVNVEIPITDETIDIERDASGLIKRAKKTRKRK